MLDTWTLGNFKSVRDNTDVKLAALTVLAGPNSSGKSTLLQSILLTTQTLANPVDARSVVLNGKILRLGSMDDLLTRNSNNLNVSIGFSYSMARPAFWPPVEYNRQPLLMRLGGSEKEDLHSLTFRYTFAADATAMTTDQAQLQPAIAECKFVLRDSDGIESELLVSRSPREPEVRAREYQLAFEGLTREDREALRYTVRLSDESGRFSTSRNLYLADTSYLQDPVGTRFTHFLPTSLVYRYDLVTARASNIVWALLNGNVSQRLADAVLSTALVTMIRGIIVDLIGKMPSLMIRQSRIEPLADELMRAPTLSNALKLIQSSGGIALAELSKRRAELVAAAREKSDPQYAMAAVPLDIASYTRDLLVNQVRYLGPLRDEPKQFYPLEGTADPTDVGLRGEFTAAVLALHRDTPIRYVSPSEWMQRRSQSRLADTTLHRAVLEWLKHLEVVSDLKAQDRGVFGHDLRVSTEGVSGWHSLVHVGVGVSQVLPILVMALIAKPESLLVLEQPELHLHPRVQTRLADFLLSIAIGGKQCIVETHSEYLINRLRLRAAEDETDILANVFALYHVEKRSGVTSYERVMVNEYGAVSDWPEGFFDQSPREAERILMAALKKRNLRKKR